MFLLTTFSRSTIILAKPRPDINSRYSLLKSLPLSLCLCVRWKLNERRGLPCWSLRDTEKRPLMWLRDASRRRSLPPRPRRPNRSTELLVQWTILTTSKHLNTDTDSTPPPLHLRTSKYVRDNLLSAGHCRKIFSDRTNWTPTFLVSDWGSLISSHSLRIICQKWLCRYNELSY